MKQCPGSLASRNSHPQESLHPVINYPKFTVLGKLLLFVRLKGANVHRTEEGMVCSEVLTL